MDAFVVNAVVGSVSAVLGGGLVWGFRGWVQRTKDKLKVSIEAEASKGISALRTGLVDAHATLFAAVDKDEATLRAVVVKVITALKSHL
jgi:hypothetical protein